MVNLGGEGGLVKGITSFFSSSKMYIWTIKSVHLFMFNHIFII